MEIKLLACINRSRFCAVYFADGALAITSDTKDMPAELNLVWEKLLPAFQASPLPPNPDEDAKLKLTLENLAVREGHTPNTIQLPGSN